MANDATASAFQEHQFDAIYPPGVERHYWNVARNAIIAEQLRKVDPGQVLEVGCGKGLVVAYLRERGFDVAGVDLATIGVLPEVEEHVRTGVDLFDLDPSRFTITKTVLLLDVIEHLEDPAAFVERIRTFIPSVKTFIFTVPARQELFSNYDEFNRHYRRYDASTLRAHVDPKGARNWRVSYFFHLLYPAAWVQLRLKGARETWYNVPKTGIERFIHNMLGYFFILDHKVFPAHWKGTSLIATVTEK
ncbi:MAG TPA: class I SAM-dependent methyltransferase [Flavobacteriales bacterium]|nr:class I SAM-dependent methyltransferase [Flavobacteriales bacterium]